MIEWLQEAGYRATSTANGKGVSSGTSGLTFGIFTYDRSIQFFMGINLEDSRVTLEDCNKINREWRFLKVTLDEGANLSVEMDIMEDFSIDEVKGKFSIALSIWDEGLGRVKNWLFELSERNAESAPEHDN